MKRGAVAVAVSILMVAPLAPPAFAGESAAAPVVAAPAVAAAKKIKNVQLSAGRKKVHINGTVVLKFFLHVSKDEQKRRFLDRLGESDKHWKFSLADLAERALWDDYMDAYEDAIAATSTDWAPWHVIPADHKWACRALVAEIICRKLDKLKLAFPEPGPDDQAALAEARIRLEQEN